MRCLILSCNTGDGHNAAGYAMKDIMEKHGHEAVTLDYLSLAGKREGSRKIEERKSYENITLDTYGRRISYACRI